MLADALQRLTEEDMGTARDQLSASVIRINATIDDVHACTSELQQPCAEDR
jgi:hypothetical protein